MSNDERGEGRVSRPIGGDSDMEVLCYVENSCAYFTTRDLSEQWGDDWNDAPYEHNAGRPYEPIVGHDYQEGDAAPWRITKVFWEGPFETPDEGYINSPFSVQDINRGAVPWLGLSRWYADNHGIFIRAGITLAGFRDAVQRAGGTVYEARGALR